MSHSPKERRFVDENKRLDVMFCAIGFLLCVNFSFGFVFSRLQPLLFNAELSGFFLVVKVAV